MSRSACGRLVLAALLLMLAACGRSDGAAGSMECSGRGLKTLRHDTLLVGTDASYEPFAFREGRGGAPVGFDIDIATEIAKRLGRKVRVVDQAYTALVPGLLAQKYDVVASALVTTPELRAQACLTDPYLPAHLGVVVNAVQGAHLEDADALNGHPVGVIAGSAGHEWARDHLTDDGTDIRTYRTDEDAFDNLEAGMLAGVVVDLPRALWRQHASKAFRVVEEIGGDPALGYAIAVDPKNAGLLEAINLVLAEMRADGTYEEIHKKWFGPTPRER